MKRPLAAVLLDARRALGDASMGAFGQRLGSSIHTGQRWGRGESRPSHAQLVKLAALVAPVSPSLAQEVASCCGSTLEQLGLLAPQQAPVRAAADPIYMADTVVCAASEVLHLLPETIRPALLAAFRRARLVGLSLEELETALGGPKATPPQAPAASKKNARGAGA
jgi:hypothetical protein